VTAPILAITVSDDDYATPVAVKRGLAYYTSSDCHFVQLKPMDLGYEEIGHFGLFHARHREDFWRLTLSWLADGNNPWALVQGPTHMQGLNLCEGHPS
jgi:predicted alpha/beta hydrolase